MHLLICFELHRKNLEYMYKKIFLEKFYGFDALSKNIAHMLIAYMLYNNKFLLKEFLYNLFLNLKYYFVDVDIHQYFLILL